MVGDQLMVGGSANGGRTSEWREDQLMVGGPANGGRTS
jgi:hypothetical protein